MASCVSVYVCVCNACAALKEISSNSVPPRFLTRNDWELLNAFLISTKNGILLKNSIF